jgi:hypothetical protein
MGTVFMISRSQMILRRERWTGEVLFKDSVSSVLGALGVVGEESVVGKKTGRR